MITKELLRLWSLCAEGYKRFCELFLEGVDSDMLMLMFLIVWMVGLIVLVVVGK